MALLCDHSRTQPMTCYVKHWRNASSGNRNCAPALWQTCKDQIEDCQKKSKHTGRMPYGKILYQYNHYSYHYSLIFTARCRAVGWSTSIWIIDPRLLYGLKTQIATRVVIKVQYLAELRAWCRKRVSRISIASKMLGVRHEKIRPSMYECRQCSVLASW